MVHFGHAFKRTYVQNKKQTVQVYFRVFTMGSLRVALDMVRHKDTQRILQKLLDETSPMPPAGVTGPGEPGGSQNRVTWVTDDP